jgi:hypothetical protein
VVEADEVVVEDRRRLPEELSAAVPVPDEADTDEEEVSGDGAEDENAETDESAGADGGDDEESEQVSEAPNLGKLKEYLAVLTRRRDALHGELRKSEEAERKLSDSLEAVKKNLIDGGSPQQIPRLVADLEGRKVATAAIRDALTKVEAATAPIAAKVQEIETAIERDRQWEASKKLRGEAADCIEDFAKGIATLTAPLLRRLEVWGEIRSKYPLVPSASLSFDRLVGEVDAALGRPGAFAVRFYLVRLLNGALSGSQINSLDPAVARRLGIAE